MSPDPSTMLDLTTALGLLTTYTSTSVLDVLKAELLNKDENFDSIFEKSISDASSEFEGKYPDVAISSPAVRPALTEAVEVDTSIINQEKNILILRLRDALCSKGLFYINNDFETERMAYEYSECFVRCLFCNLLASQKFSPRVYYSLFTGLSDGQKRSAASLQAEVEALGKKLDDGFEKLSEQTFSQFEKTSPVEVSGSDESHLSKEALSKISLLNELQNDEGQDALHKSRKLCFDLIFEVPQSSQLLGNKILRKYLSVCIALGDKYATECLHHYDNTASKNFKSPYTDCQRAALLTNLGKVNEAMAQVESIKGQDIFTFSPEQKNTYYRIYSTCLLNCKKLKKAKEMFLKVDNSDESEDTLFLKLVLFKDDPSYDLSNEALTILQTKKKSVRMQAVAANYFLFKYEIRRDDLGNNPFEAVREFKPVLTLAFENLTSLSEEFKDFENFNDSTAGLALINIGFLLNKRLEIIPLAEEMVRKGFNQDQLLVNLASCYILEGSFEKAFHHLTKISTKVLLELKAEDMLILSAKKSANINHLKKISKSPDLNELSARNNDRIIIKITKALYGPQRAIKEGKKLLSKYKHDSWLLFFIAESLIDIEDFKSAESYLLEAVKLENNDLRHNHILGRFYAQNLGDFTKAILYYGPIVSSELPEGELYLYFISLFKLKRYEEIINKVEQLDPNKSLDSVQMIKGYALGELGYIDIAYNILKPLAHKNSGNETDLNNYLRIVAKKNDINEMIWVNQQICKIYPDDRNANFNLGFLFSQVGKHDRAIDHSKRALLKNFKDELCHYNFFIVFTEASQRLESDNPLFSDENVKLYQDVTKNFEKRFPKSNLIWSEEIIKKDTGKLNIEKIKETLHRMEKRQDKIKGLYSKNNMPISAISKMLGRNAFETLGFVSNSYLEDGFSSDFLPENRLKIEFDWLVSANELIMCTYSLIAYALVDEIDVLKNLNFNIVVLSSTKEEILRIHKSTLSSKAGQMQLATVNGQIVKDEITEKQLSFKSNICSKILNFIDSSCEIRTAPEHELKGSPTGFEDVLSQEFNEIIHFCKTGNYLCITADGNFRALLHSMDLPSVGLKSLLTYTYKAGLVDEKKFNNILMNWIAFNFKGLRYTTINCALFLGSGVDSQKIERFLYRVFYSNDFNDESSRVNFLGDLISKVCMYSDEQLNPIAKAMQKHFASKPLTLDLLKTFSFAAYRDIFNDNRFVYQLNKLIDDLGLKSDSGHVIVSRDCRRLFVEGYKKEKELEEERLNESLDL